MTEYIRVNKKRYEALWIFSIMFFVALAFLVVAQHEINSLEEQSQSCPEGFKCEKIEYPSCWWSQSQYVFVNATTEQYSTIRKDFVVKDNQVIEHSVTVVYKNGTEIPRCGDRE